VQTVPPLGRPQVCSPFLAGFSPFFGQNWLPHPPRVNFDQVTFPSTNSQVPFSTAGGPPFSANGAEPSSFSRSLRRPPSPPRLFPPFTCLPWRSVLREPGVYPPYERDTSFFLRFPFLFFLFNWRRGALRLGDVVSSAP